jgi:hypothetical protein
MKRALIIILTTFAFVACSKDDVVMEYRGEAIDFNASNGNITRAEDDKSYTENVPQFHVWGYYTNGATSAIKMKDVLVKKSGDSWSYDNIQFGPRMELLTSSLSILRRQRLQRASTRIIVRDKTL